jgi:tape measure domain-containing protein
MPRSRPLDSAAYEILLKDGFTRVLSQMEGRLNQFEKKISDTNKKMKDFGGNTGGGGGFMKDALSAATGFTMANALGRVVDMTKEAVMWTVKLGAEWQQTKIAYTTMLGSRDYSKRILGELQAFSEATPFSQDQVIGGSRQMLAYGFDPKTITKDMTMLGDVSAGLSLRLDDLVYVYGTLKSQGRAYTRDIMQFAMRGIPIYDALAETLKKPRNELKGMLEDGKIGFKEVEAAFKYMTREGSMFGGLMAKQAKSLSGRWETFVDKIANAGRNFSESNLVDPLSNFLGVLTDLIPETRAVADTFMLSEKSIKDNELRIQELVKRHNELTGKTRLSKNEQVELKDVMNEIATIAPGLVTSWDQYGNAIGIATTKMDGFIQKNREWLKAEQKTAMQQKLTEVGELLARQATLQTELNSGLSIKAPSSARDPKDKAGQWLRSMYTLNDREMSARRDELKMFADDQQGWGKSRASIVEYLRMNQGEHTKELDKLLKFYGVNIDDLDINKVFGKEADKPKNDGSAAGTGQDGTSGIEKIQASTRNIRVDIRQLVGEVKFESYEANETDLVKKVTRALISAVNDVNLVGA